MNYGRIPKLLVMSLLLNPALVIADNITTAHDAEKHYLDAWTSRDATGVEVVLSARYIYIGADGERHNKQWNMDMLRSGRLLYDGYETIAGPVFDLDDVVIIMGHLHAPVAGKDKSLLKIILQQGRKWKLLILSQKKK